MQTSNTPGGRQPLSGLAPLRYQGIQIARGMPEQARQAGAAGPSAAAWRDSVLLPEHGLQCGGPVTGGALDGLHLPAPFMGGTRGRGVVSHATDEVRRTGRSRLRQRRQVADLFRTPRLLRWRRCNGAARFTAPIQA